MREEQHHLECKAPICVEDSNPNYKKEVIWRPGELVCQKTPYQKFQKKQLEINELLKKGEFKNMEFSYTANDLETYAI